MHDRPGQGTESSEAHLKQMRLVRQFVSQLIGEQEGEGSSVLSDEEWSGLCEAAGEADSDETAIARVVLRAYGLPVDGGAPSTTENGGPRPAVPAVPPVFLPTSDPILPLSPIPVPVSSGGSVPIGTAVTAQSPISPLDPIPVSFEGKAWPVLDHPATSPTRSSSGVVPPSLVPVAAAQPSQELEAAPYLLPTGPLVSPPGSTDPLAGVAPVEIQPGVQQRAHTRKRARVMEDRRRERLLTVASWVRNFGAIILLFVAWQLWGTAITQHHAQNTLEHQFAAKVQHAPVKAAPGFTLTPATTRIPDPPQGTVMAHLQIPKIGLDQYVVSGTAEVDLAKGPGHYLGTAMPGQAGNVAIAGHRTTHGAPFNRLAELAIGDPIYLTTSSGQTLTYIVSAVPVAVSPSDVTVLNNFGDDRLTLTTCNPEYSAVQRLIVVAAYLPPGATHPVPIAKGTGKAYKLAPVETSGWNTTLLPLVAIEMLALAGLGLAYRKLSRVYGRSGRWLILAPIWLALLLALFETLTNFLPAAV